MLSLLPQQSFLLLLHPFAPIFLFQSYLSTLTFPQLFYLAQLAFLQVLTIFVQWFFIFLVPSLVFSSQLLAVSGVVVLVWVVPSTTWPTPSQVSFYFLRPFSSAWLALCPVLAFLFVQPFIWLFVRQVLVFRELLDLSWPASLRLVFIFLLLLASSSLHSLLRFSLDASFFLLHSWTSPLPFVCVASPSPPVSPFPPVPFVLSLQP